MGSKLPGCQRDSLIKLALIRGHLVQLVTIVDQAGRGDRYNPEEYESDKYGKQAYTKLRVLHDSVPNKYSDEYLEYKDFVKENSRVSIFIEASGYSGFKTSPIRCGRAKLLLSSSEKN